MIEGLLADIDGVRHGQVIIENGVIVAVGERLAIPQHIFSEDCLIFAGMGDIHIHAREDVSGKDTHKETFATASAAALHGGVIHVADMPNNPIAPIDDASYQAKENARSPGQSACDLHPLCRHWSRHSAAASERALQGLHGPKRRRVCSSAPWRNWIGRWPLITAGTSASTARILSC